MKTKLIGLLFAAGTVLIACNEEEGPCETRDPIPDCNCTMEYDPVCGCDNVTYGNACSAACSGVPSSTPGPCD